LTAKHSDGSGEHLVEKGADVTAKNKVCAIEGDRMGYFRESVAGQILF
jgi:hypothetical protein